MRPLCSFTVPEFEGSSYRITSLSYSPDGQDVLVSYSSDHLYLFSIKVMYQQLGTFIYFIYYIYLYLFYNVVSI